MGSIWTKASEVKVLVFPSLLGQANELTGKNVPPVSALKIRCPAPLSVIYSLSIIPTSA